MPAHEVYIILGNGFDIECGLKTNYSCFLDFIKTVNEHYYQPYYLRQKNILDPFISRHSMPLPMFDITKWNKMMENFWYHHFVNVAIPKNWIDFENEISYVISLVKKETRGHSLDDEMYGVSGKFRNTIDQIERRLSNPTFRDLRNKLLEELKDFSFAFDQYLQYFAEHAIVEPTDAVSNLISRLTDAKCHVLSFNYTTTFERMANEHCINSDIEYCYIHGKVGHGDYSNLVLGIEENQEDMDEVDILYAPFSKYYQRVYKCTDSQYYDWLRRMENYNANRELYIFGHSLGASDKTILKEFITSSGMKTTVFSHNMEARERQIANMMAIIGGKNMVEKNSGLNKTLEFLPQSLC